MIFKNFRINIAIRVVLLTATIFGFAYVYQAQELYITTILLGALILFQLFSLIYFAEKTNRDLTSFLESIRHADFTRSYQGEKMGGSFDELQRAFNEVIQDFQQIRSEKEEHYYYIQNIIQHIDIGIIAFQQDGTIEMINNAAQKLFQLFNLDNIKKIGEWSEELEKTLEAINSGENALVKVKDEEDLLQLSVYATEFKLNNRYITLVSIKDIQAELDEKEMEAWQKLIRVLTHEIMNSIAPISSLSSTTNSLVSDVAESVKEKLPDNNEYDDILDIQNALKTIHKRSDGLISFVQTYRNLTKIPKPNFDIFPVNQLFDNIHSLMAEEINTNDIDFTIKITPESLQLTADENLIEQVVINMVKNSIHALENKENKQIRLKAFENRRGRVNIQVIDNGHGILKEVEDKIFIPFFTTKQKGSGIGLSLSKQILRLHGGNISVKSNPEVETIFTLSFNISTQ